MDDIETRKAELQQLHKDYRDPPREYVAVFNKTWTRDGQTHSLKLDYVGHADATDILLRSDPFWTWEPFAVDERGLPAMDRDSSGNMRGMWINLTVHGVTRPGYGTIDAGKGPDGVKELIGDAIRNASMRFGIATKLWSKAEWGELAVEQGDELPEGTSASTSPAPTRAAGARKAAGATKRAAPKQQSATRDAEPPAQQQEAPPTSLAEEPERAAESLYDDEEFNKVAPEELVASVRDEISKLRGPQARAYASYRREHSLPDKVEQYSHAQALRLLDFLDELEKALPA